MSFGVLRCSVSLPQSSSYLKAPLLTTITVLMFVLWYCYKRGREQRLEQEKTGEPIDGSDRIEELPDDLMIEGPPRHRETGESRSRDWDAESNDSREDDRAH